MFKNKVNIKKTDAISFVLIIIIFMIDRISKMYVIDIIQSKGREIFLFDFLNLTLNWNTGIAFGFLSANANICLNYVNNYLFNIFNGCFR